MNDDCDEAADDGFLDALNASAAGIGQMKRIKQYFHFEPFSKKQRKILNWWCDTSPVKDKMASLLMELSDQVRQ